MSATDFEVKGKVVLVTGGASGVGAGIVKGFIEEGAKHVAFWDIDDNGKQFEIELNSKYGDNRSEFYKCDVTNDDQVNTTFDALVAKHGNIDVVVNNAGIMNDEQYKKEIEINLVALVSISLKALKHMRMDEGGKGGAILNIASVAGLRQSPWLPVYFATKIGVLQFSNCLGMEENYSRTGVRVITVALGGTNTGLITEQNLRYIDDFMKTKNTELFKKIPIQSVDSAVKGVLVAFQRGGSGSTWLAAHDQPPKDYTPNVKAAFNCLFHYDNLSADS